MDEISPKIFKTPPIKSWKKFPPNTLDRKSGRNFNVSSTPKGWGQISTAISKHKVPCFPSPIDRIKFGINRRTHLLELEGDRSYFKKSFEGNQSFPRAATGRHKNFQPYNDDIDYLDDDISFKLRKFKIDKMEKIRVDGANGLRFSARRNKGCFTPVTGSPFNSSIVNSASDSLMRIPKSEINPNKAVFTIDSKSSQILIVNHNACQLLGYTSKELCDMQFSTLLSNKNKTHVSALAEGQLNSEDGTMVLLSGKVVEMNTKCGTPVAVSLWIRQIDIDGRCLAVAEPVERRVAQIIIDRSGFIVSGDYEALLLFQMDTLEQFTGMDITTLIPAIQLPDADNSLIAKNIRKQKATGKTQDGISFPLCLMITHQDNNTDGSADTTDSGLSNPIMNNSFYVITIWVFTNLSGLMVIDEMGFIESCNHHFSMLMFGFAQNKIIGQQVTKIIPNFGQELEYLGYNRSRNATISSLDNEESETETDPVYVERTDCTTSISGYNSDRLSSCTDTTTSKGCGIPSSGGGCGFSESVQICLDFTASPKVGNSVISELSNDLSIKSLSNDEQNSIQHSALVKSMSDNILLVENYENNKNIANTENIIQGNNKNNSEFITTSTTSAALNVAANSKGGIVSNENGIDAVGCSFLSNCNNGITGDNELLTPVNETDRSYLTTSTQLTNNLTQSSSEDVKLYQQQQQSSDSLPFVANVSVGGSSASSNQNVLSTPKINKINKNVISNTDVRRLSGSIITTATTTTSPQQPPITATTSLSSSSFLASMATGTGVDGKKQYNDGKYKGEAIHCDGNVIDIVYTISCQILPCGEKVYCVWICRDPDTNYGAGDDDDDLNEDDEERQQNLTLTFNSVTSTVENSLGQAIKITAAQNSSSRPNSMSLISQCEDEQISGEFSKNYTTLKQIGKGAYGYVKMAYRNSDRLLVIAKFILKEKLCPQFMITTEDKKEIPMEIYLLTTVKHPNIVTVFDVFENEKFFQLVMEKHGSGMDLFEFIDRLPMMDEKLACFIFRQIANAIDYLHSLKILHRDIKDENIIIDQNFHVKLIDFGSATFMEDGKYFSTFFGTTEYCSPEVLAGNKYAGPELEIWSLGVTLYVIMFFENPFVDVEETLHADLVMPHKVTQTLEALLLSMLDKDPKTRCTMKQLMQDPWLTQEINPAMFNFSCIVPCEPHEANPDKYYTGQVYSSSTQLCSTSPHDSLSLADDDYMIDVEGDDEESLPSQNDEESSQKGAELINSMREDLPENTATNMINQLSQQIDKIDITGTTTAMMSPTSTIIDKKDSQGKIINENMKLPLAIQNAEKTASEWNGSGDSHGNKSNYEIISVSSNNFDNCYDNDSWDEDGDEEDSFT